MPPELPDDDVDEDKQVRVVDLFVSLTLQALDLSACGQRQLAGRGATG